ncbi:MAG: molybdopterin-synthase adenylyltransferase MoeB [Pseudomonadota bacterium]
MLNERQINRYARHILLPEVGATGQEKLLDSRVLIVGAGGLGAPLIMYLAAAGVGTLGIIDDDTVDLSNLQRQVIHREADIDRPKVESAQRFTGALDPEIKIEPVRARLTADNVAEVIAGYDLVADGSDNFDTRYVLNQACFEAGVPLVSAAVLRFEGQIATYRPRDRDGKPTGLPCYRCLFPERPPPDMIPSCSEAGVLGALTGLVGSLQAAEVVKELLQIGESLAGSLLLIDALGLSFEKLSIRADPNCPTCGVPRQAAHG